MNKPRIFMRVAQVATVAALVIVFAALIADTVPDAAHKAQGIALESSRQLSGGTAAPVEYTFNGERRVDFVTGKVVAGESVTFYVNEAGEPADNSWGIFAVFTVVVGLFFLAAAIIFPLSIWLALVDRVERADLKLNAAASDSTRWSASTLSG